MRFVLRSLIVWLVLLAVPFQGFASATMLLCAPVSPMRAHYAPSAAVVAHDHQAMMATAGEHDHHATMAAASADAGDSGVDHHSTTKCSACAACCIGAAAAPMTSSPLPATEAQFVSIPFHDGQLPSVDPDHPERPPRSSLA